MSRYANATIAELARDAQFVQSASNLRAIAASYVEVLDRLRALGETCVAAHPVARVWADKIASLCGLYADAGDAHEAVSDLANS